MKPREPNHDAESPATRMMALLGWLFLAALGWPDMVQAFGLGPTLLLVAVVTLLAIWVCVPPRARESDDLWHMGPTMAERRRQRR